MNAIVSVELEGPEQLRDLAAEMLQALKEQFTCSEIGLGWALMLMLRSEFDRNVGREFGLATFSELLQLEPPAPLAFSLAGQPKPEGMQ